VKRLERDGPEKEFPMNTNRICALAFAAAMLVGGAAVLSAAEPSKEDAALSAKLITAIEKADYESFITEADAPVKKALTKEQFAATSAHFAARFHAGYEVSYLGDLNQYGCHVTLWKISFKDHSDDALVTQVVKGGKVAGYWIK
jgi:hypothetical protein